MCVYIYILGTNLDENEIQIMKADEKDSIQIA